MKLNKYTSALVALGLFSMAGLATAQNNVYITGSSAFRPAIYDALNTRTFDAAPTITAYKCSTIGPIDGHTASYMNFAGNIGGQPYVVRCAWSGSEAGIQDAAQGTLEAFMDDSNPSGLFTSTPTTTISHAADLALADTDQQDSLTPSPGLTGKKVGIVPFLWLKNAQVATGATGGAAVPPADWSRLTNVTDPELRVALSGGSPLALFTANPADTKWVYVAGRDNFSGTFVNTMLDTQFGLVNNPGQIEITATGAGGTAAINPPNLISGKGKNVEGFNSGGSLATEMTITGSSTAVDPIQTANTGSTVTGWYAISYIGMFDADVSLGIQGSPTAPNGVAAALTYNGVAENAANVENGTYSFWGNEWLFRSKNNLSAYGLTIYNKFTTGGAIDAVIDNNHEIQLGSMVASKTTSAADATHN